MYMNFQIHFALDQLYLIFLINETLFLNQNETELHAYWAHLDQQHSKLMFDKVWIAINPMVKNQYVSFKMPPEFTCILRPWLTQCFDP